MIKINETVTFFYTIIFNQLLSGQISIKFGFKGLNHSVVTACATGALLLITNLK